MSEKWRLLKKGEIILATDEYLDETRGWIPTQCAGTKAPDPKYTSHRQYRRWENRAAIREAMEGGE